MYIRQKKVALKSSLFRRRNDGGKGGGGDGGGGDDDDGISDGISSNGRVASFQRRPAFAVGEIASVVLLGRRRDASDEESPLESTTRFFALRNLHDVLITCHSAFAPRFSRWRTTTARRRSCTAAARATSSLSCSSQS